MIIFSVEQLKEKGIEVRLNYDQLILEVTHGRQLTDAERMNFKEACKFWDIFPDSPFADRIFMIWQESQIMAILEQCMESEAR